MTCMLRAGGPDFLVDDFLQGSILAPCAVYHQGEARLESKPDSKGRAASGFQVVVSEAGFDALSNQIEDAISFLQRHRAELERLRQFPGVADARLDFGIYKRDVTVQCDYFPPELLSLAGHLRIGIELSLYDGDDMDAIVNAFQTSGSE